MPVSQAERDTERAKYARAYAKPTYHMSAARLADSRALLAALPHRGSYLDVGCGRREMLRAALQLGFLPVHGTEIVPELVDGATVVEAWVQALPFADRTFDTVSCLDVLEHLDPSDVERAARELARVARRHLLLSTNLKSSQAVKGEELHRTRWAYDAWHATFETVYLGHRIDWDRTDPAYGGNFWRVDLC